MHSDQDAASRSASDAAVWRAWVVFAVSGEASHRFRAYFRPRTVAMGDLVELLAIFREMTIANLKRIALAEPPQSTLLEQAVTKEHKETIMAKHLQEKLDKHRSGTFQTASQCSAVTLWPTPG